MASLRGGRSMNGDLSQVWEGELWVNPASCPESYESPSSHSVSLLSVFHLHVPALQYTHELGATLLNYELLVI